jgi:hypothetical protein
VITASISSLCSPHADAAVGISVSTFASYPGAGDYRGVLIHGLVTAAAADFDNCPNAPGDGSDGSDTFCTYVRTEMDKKISGEYYPFVVVAGAGPEPTTRRLELIHACPGTSAQSGPFRTLFQQHVASLLPTKPAWDDIRFDAGKTLDCSLRKINVQPPPT